MVQLYNALLASLFWGLRPFTDKIILNNTKLLPITIALLRNIFQSFIIIILFFLIRNKLNSLLEIKKELKSNFKIIFLIILAGFFATLGFIFFLFSLSENKNPLIVVTTTYSLPIVIFSILNFLFLKQPIFFTNILGIIFIIIGIYFTSSNKEFKFFF